jgi:hypothetical protein
LDRASTLATLSLTWSKRSCELRVARTIKSMPLPRGRKTRGATTPPDTSFAGDIPAAAAKASCQEPREALGSGSAGNPVSLGSRRRNGNATEQFVINAALPLRALFGF